ncbi:SDR family oxidoreductase [Streptomyces sp. BPTC-684]|uniref:SDR family NAD(P)-dependent oxidoreductase n=1 Tax=Streptomyces sp. BPTC-684 TaxID=3043734 RepID=UPI0024B1118C|nr:SDR family oxidoreductase [Streptomyces sp. BPTC-684]WHM36494.1 SDR family oxidoreductase [Streptomyces sp. BPTC-684]
MGRLTDKTALVTGASRGIGRGIARRLARDGALVAVHYSTGETEAKETAALIGEEGGQAFTVRADISEPDQVAELFGALERELTERTGSTALDILVNNAAFSGHTALPGDVTAELLDQYYAVNARAPFLIAQRALQLIPQGGRIVNISSGITRSAQPDMIAYAMSKGVIEQLTLHLARHVADRGITVNSVAPGLTDNGKPMFSNPAVVARLAELSAFKRVGQVEDIADVVAFVVSDDARWITGSYIDASGGTLLG